MKRIAFLAVISFCSTVFADTIILRNGGQVRGKVKVNRDANQRLKDYVVALETGGHIKFSPGQVAKHVESSPRQNAYQDLLNTMPDTADSHWQMAKFCSENGLIDRKDFHLQRALTLDENHQEVRKSLGHIWKDGKWISQSEEMQRRGFERYKGKWQLSRDVEIAKRKDEIEFKTKQIKREMRLWRKWLNGKRHNEAVRNFRSLRDPLALPGLVELLAKEKKNPKNRRMYIEALGKMSVGQATEHLVNSAMFDGDPDVRETAAENLRKRNDKAYAARLIIPYLSDKENKTVNQAGWLLGQVGDEDTILPLIDALVTTHKRVFVPKSSHQATFSNQGGIGFSAGQKPRVETSTKKNRSVHTALVSITKQNFLYSKPEWKSWYVSKKTPKDFDLRRDP